MLPKLHHLIAYDNSAEAGGGRLANVKPRLLLRTIDGIIAGPSDLSATHARAKPIVAAALDIDAARRREQD